MGNNKVAVITGASRGIGRETALKFAQNGYHVTLAGRDIHEMEKLGGIIRKTHQAEVLVCAADLDREESWTEVVHRTVKKWGRLDVLVNNAAWRTIEPMQEMSLANWEKTIRICLTAPAFLAKLAAEAMEIHGTGGVIVNLSSVMSQRPAGYSPAYIACKGGMESLTYELAALYGPKGIRVVCVNPGNVATDMSSDYVDRAGNNISELLAAEMNDATPLKRAGTAAEVASVIYWLASPEASFITGTTILADGGFSHNFNGYKMKHLQFPEIF